VKTALKDLARLKAGEVVQFSKKNQILPFENDTSIEFFSHRVRGSVVQSD
jgi:hypothetical protein